MAIVRAFIACDIPESLLENVSNVQDKLRALGADVVWTRISGIHITLRFLGDIREEIIDAVHAVIKDASKGLTPFDISIRGCGAFPNQRSPRVLWLGVEDGTGVLTGLQQALDGGLKALGFEPEDRGFRPHLTLGRVKGVKGRERLSSAVSELKESEIGSFTVDRVILYKSELKPTGAVYTKLREVKL